MHPQMARALIEQRQAEIQRQARYAHHAREARRLRRRPRAVLTWWRRATIFFDMKNPWTKTWTKSSLCDADQQCVEAALLPDGGMALRHSRYPEEELQFTKGEWDTFVGGARLGEFDRFGDLT